MMFKASLCSLRKPMSFSSQSQTWCSTQTLPILCGVKPVSNLSAYTFMVRSLVVVVRSIMMCSESLGKSLRPLVWGIQVEKPSSSVHRCSFDNHWDSENAEFPTQRSKPELSCEHRGEHQRMQTKKLCWNFSFTQIPSTLNVWRCNDD